jgi:hypothetical protein
MSDDWRVEIDVAGHGGVRHLMDRARERAVAKEARDALGDGVVITVDDDRLYAYAESEARAREAEERLRALAGDHDLEVTATIARWHPDEERWEPLDSALPSTDEARAAEHEALESRQAAEAADRGYAEWEVRVELADHDAAKALASRLESEGLTVVCRSNHTVVAAATEDDAKALAERLRREVPSAASVTAEGSAAVAMDALDPLSVITGRWRRA